MKKISLVICALSFVCMAWGQSAQFGVKGGLNISSLSNENDQMGSRLGFNAGLLAHVHLNSQWAVQPEIVYSSQGAKYTITDGEHSLALNYVNIPLLVQYMFDNGFRLQTGPQLGFLAGVNDKKGNVETDFFTSDDFKSVDLSWAAGLSYLSSSGLGADARYNFGLSNINDFGDAERRNNVFQVGLFYMFGGSNAKTK